MCKVSLKYQHQQPRISATATFKKAKVNKSQVANNFQAKFGDLQSFLSSWWKFRIKKQVQGVENKSKPSVIELLFAKALHYLMLNYMYNIHRYMKFNLYSTLLHISFQVI